MIVQIVTTASTSNQIVGDHQTSTKSNAKADLGASSLFIQVKLDQLRTTHEKFVNREVTLFIVIRTYYYLCMICYLLFSFSFYFRVFF